MVAMTVGQPPLCSFRGRANTRQNNIAHSFASVPSLGDNRGKAYGERAWVYDYPAVCARQGQRVSADTDRELVRRVQKGDAKAFDLLFLRYQHKIHGLVGRYVHAQEEVEDVVQEAFIKAYRALPRFRGESAFYTWLYRIAVNTSKNYLVSRARRPQGVELDASEGDVGEVAAARKDTEDPESALRRDELRAVVDRALGDLPEDLRAALTLREFDGLSYEQIATVMDCPVGTVRSRIFRAREAVDEQIRPHIERKSRRA